ncbi:hypothetical protein FRB90_008040 [Tulasnella sp. 427]|nr:hypothetical protein FRB90_008040 [Tulasnella sp. 427]
MSSPAQLLGNTPSSPSLIVYVERISSDTNPPAVEIKSYSDAVYFNYHGLGLSLLFVPTNGYKPRTSSTRTELKDQDLVLESVDIYNAQPKGTKDSRSGFSIFPSLPISLRIPGETTSTSTLEDFNTAISNSTDPALGLSVPLLAQLTDDDPNQALELYQNVLDLMSTN